MKHFNRDDLKFISWYDKIDERYQITQYSADECPIVVSYQNPDVGKVVYDKGSNEIYYDDDVEFVGVFLVDEEDCQDDEYFCFKLKEENDDE